MTPNGSVKSAFDSKNQDIKNMVLNDLENFHINSLSQGLKTINSIKKAGEVNNGKESSFDIEKNCVEHPVKTLSLIEKTNLNKVVGDWDEKKWNEVFQKSLDFIEKEKYESKNKLIDNFLSVIKFSNFKEKELDAEKVSSLKECFKSLDSLSKTTLSKKHHDFLGGNIENDLNKKTENICTPKSKKPRL